MFVSTGGLATWDIVSYLGLDYQRQSERPAKAFSEISPRKFMLSKNGKLDPVKSLPQVVLSE